MEFKFLKGLKKSKEDKTENRNENNKNNKKNENEKKKRTLKEKLLLDAKTWQRDFSFKSVAILFAWSLVVNLIIEILGQMKYGGFFEAFITLAENPLVFIYNSLIIMTTISVAMLFRRCYFWMVLLSFVWIGLGVANYIILSYRVTPFSAVELKLIDAAMGVLKSYVSTGTLIALIAGIAIAVIAVVALWKKVPVKKYVNLVSSIVIFAGCILLLEVSTFAGLKTGVIATQLPNLSESYVDYGFVYCFSNSLINTGISKPKGYSEEKVSSIKDDVEKKMEEATDEAVLVTDAPDSGNVVTPNIIFLQLESFFDITAVKDLVVSEDPIPFFRSCMEQYSSGYLSVPVVGAGTANTEFETITGMNLDFFGPGEYPFKTVLKDRTCETIAYNLKSHGYTTHVMHNNRASFYGRNEVYAQFGFDIFTSMELMDIEEYTENGWAKDKILTGEITKSLTATSTPDYMYVISVQGHGGYPIEKSLEEQKIQVTGAAIETEEERNSFQYYVNQIYEMDLFIQDLAEQLKQHKEQTGEDTILVAYGDHLPSIGYTEEDLANANMYQTQYFIWNTMDLQVTKEDLQAYQLASRVLGLLGISDGEINAYHQANKGNEEAEEYLEDLKVLGYDMFYGDNYSTSGESVYVATDIQYGVTNVEITNVFRDQSDPDYLMIRGHHFTKYSAVYINEEKVPCERMDKNTLRISLEKVTEPITVSVKQSYKGKLILQTSNEIIYTPERDANVPEPDGDSTEIQPTESAQSDTDLAGMIDEQEQTME